MQHLIENRRFKVVAAEQSGAFLSPSIPDASVREQNSVSIYLCRMCKIEKMQVLMKDAVIPHSALQIAPDHVDFGI